MLSLAQALIGVDLAINNRLQIDQGDLDVFNKIPPGSGLILTPNHADEMDPRLCMRLSQLCNKRFIFMGNREAFDEMHGLGGWGLQRLGVFSVERGGRDRPAKSYALDVVRAGKDVLVIFPEGEIFYLNDSVQPFHSGAVDIGINAVIDRRKHEPNWTTYVVPMAIRYTYAEPINHLLELRIAEMEKHLSRTQHGHDLHKRISGLMSEVLKREMETYKLQSDSEKLHQLSDQVKLVRRAILSQVELKYKGIAAEQARTIDRAWQLSAHVRKIMADGSSGEHHSILEKDLSQLKEVSQMASWQPEYWETATSMDRLAEIVLKLEREIFKIKRPPQLAKRTVFVRIGEPVDLATFIPEFDANPHSLRHSLAEQLRTTIQHMIDGIDAKMQA